MVTCDDCGQRVYSTYNGRCEKCEEILGEVPDDIKPMALGWIDYDDDNWPNCFDDDDDNWLDAMESRQQSQELPEDYRF